MLSDRGMVILLTIYSESTILCCVPMLTAWCRWKMPKDVYKRQELIPLPA